MSSKKSKKTQKLGSSRRYRNHNRDIGEKDNNDDLQDPGNEDHDSEQSQFLTVSENQSCNETSPPHSDQAVTDCPTPSTLGSEDFSHIQSQDFKDLLAQDEVQSKKRKMGSTRKINRNLKSERFHEDDSKPRILLSEGASNEQGVSTEEITIEDRGREDQTCEMDFAPYQASEHQDNQKGDEKQHGERPLQNKPTGISFSELNQAEDTAHSSHDFGVVMPTESNVPLEELDEPLQIGHRMDTLSEPVVSLSHTKDQKSKTGTIYTPLIENRDEQDVQRSPNTRIQIKSSKSEETVLETTTVQSISSLLIRDKQERKDGDIQETFLAEDKGQDEDSDLQLSSLINKQEHGTQDEKVTTVILQNVGTKASTVDEDIVGYSLELKDDTLKLNKKSDYGSENTGFRENIDENKEVCGGGCRTDNDLNERVAPTNITQATQPDINIISPLRLEDPRVQTSADQFPSNEFKFQGDKELKDHGEERVDVTDARCWKGESSADKDIEKKEVDICYDEEEENRELRTETEVENNDVQATTTNQLIISKVSSTNMFCTLNESELIPAETLYEEADTSTQTCNLQHSNPGEFPIESEMQAREGISSDQMYDNVTNERSGFLDIRSGLSEEVKNDIKEESNAGSTECFTKDDFKTLNVQKDDLFPFKNEHEMPSISTNIQDSDFKDQVSMAIKQRGSESSEKGNASLVHAHHTSTSLKLLPGSQFKSDIQVYNNIKAPVQMENMSQECLVNSTNMESEAKQFGSTCPGVCKHESRLGQNDAVAENMSHAETQSRLSGLISEGNKTDNFKAMKKTPQTESTEEITPTSVDGTLSTTLEICPQSSESLNAMELQADKLDGSVIKAVVKNDNTKTSRECFKAAQHILADPVSINQEYNLVDRQDEETVMVKGICGGVDTTYAVLPDIAEHLVHTEVLKMQSRTEDGQPISLDDPHQNTYPDLKLEQYRSPICTEVTMIEPMDEAEATHQPKGNILHATTTPVLEESHMLMNTNKSSEKMGSRHGSLELKREEKEAMYGDVKDISGTDRARLKETEGVVSEETNNDKREAINVGPTKGFIMEDLEKCSQQYMYSELTSEKYSDALTTIKFHAKVHCDLKEDFESNIENMVKAKAELQTQSQTKKKKKFGSTRRPQGRHQLHAEGEEREGKDSESTEEIIQAAASNLLTESHNTKSKVVADVHDFPVTTDENQIANSEVEISNREIYAPPATLSNEVEQIDTGVFDEVSHAEEPAGTIEKNEKPSLNEEKDAESTLPCEQEIAPIITKIQDDGFSENASQAKGKESPVPQHASEVNADSTSGSVELNPEAQAMSIMQMDTENTQVDASNQIQNITEAKTESEPEQLQSTITPDSEQKNKPEAIKEKENPQEQNMDQNLINIGAIKKKKPDADPTEKIIKQDITAIFSDQYIPRELSSQTTDLALTTVEHPSLGTEQPDFKEDDGDRKENVENKNTELQTQIQSKKKKKFGSTRRSHGRHQLHSEGEDGERKDPENTEEISQTATSNLLKESQNTMNEAALDVDDLPMTTKQKQIINSEVEIMTGEINAPPATLSNKVDEINMQVSDEVSNVERITAIKDKNENPTELPDFKEDDGDSIENVENKNTELQTQIPSKKKKFGSTRRPQRRHQLHADGEEEEEKDPESTEEIIPAAASNLLSKPQNTKSKVVPDVHDFPVTTDENQIANSEVEISNREIYAPPATLSNEVEQIDTGVFDEVSHAEEPAGTIEKNEKPSLNEEKDAESTLPCEQEMAPIITKIQDDGFSENASQAKGKESPVPQHASEVNADSTSGSVELNPEAQAMSIMQMHTENTQVDASNQIQNITEAKTESEPEQPQSTITPDSEQKNKPEAIKEKENPQEQNMDQNLINIGAVKEKKPDADPTEKIIKEDITAIFSDQYIPSELSSQTTDLALTTVEHPSLGTEQPDFKEDDVDRKENAENKNAELQTQIQSKKKKFGSTRRSHGRHQLHAEGEDGERRDPENTEEISQTATSNLLKEPQNTMSEAALDVDDLPMTTKQKQIINSEVEIMTGEIYAPPATLSNEVEQIDTGVFDEVSHAEEPAGTIEKNEKPSLNEEKDAESTLPCEQEMAPIIIKIQDDGFSENASQAKGKESPVPQHASEVNADSTSGSVELNPEAQAMSIMQMDTENTQVDASNQIQNITEAKTESEPEQPQSTITPDSEQKNKPEAIKEKENPQEQNMDQNLINIGAIKEKKPDADPTEKLSKEDITAIFSDQYIPSELSSQTTDLALTTVEHPSLGTEQPDFKEDDGDRKENVENKNTKLQTQIQSKKKKKFGSTRRSHGRHQLHAEGEDGERKDPENTEEISQTATSNLLKEPQNTMNEAALDVDDLPMTTKQKQIINSEVEIMTGEINAPPATLSNKVDEINMQVSDEVSNVERITAIKDKNENATELPDFKEDDGDSIENVENKNTELQTQIPSKKKKFGSTRRPQRRHQLHADGEEREEKDPESTEEIIPAAASNLLSKPQNTKSKVVADVHDFPVTTDENQIANSEVEISNREIYAPPATLSNEVEQIDTGVFDEVSHAEEPAGTIEKNEKPSLNEENDAESTLPCEQEMAPIITKIQEELPDFKEDDGDSIENVENKNAELHSQTQMKKKKFGSTRRTRGRYQLHAEGEQGEEKDSENSEEITEAATSDLFSETQNTMNIMIGEIDAPSPTLSNKVDPINMEVSDGISNSALTVVKNENITVHPDFGTSLGNVENKNTERHTQTQMKKKKKLGSTRRSHGRHQVHAEGEDGEEKDVKDTVEMQTVDQAVSFNLPAKLQNVSEFSVDTLEPMLRIEQGADGTENKNTNQQTYITHGPMEVICVTEERIEDFETQIQNELYQPEGSLLSEIEVCLNKSFECSLNTTAEQLPEDSLHLSSSKNPDIHMEPNSPARRRKMGSSRKISKNKSAEDISTDSKESRKKNENLDEDNAKHSESKREAKPVEETVISEGTEDRKESGELTSEVKAVSQINESSTQATGQPVPEGRRKFGSRRTAKASGGIGAFTHDDFESNQNQKDVRGTKDELRVSDQDLVSAPESTPISYPDSVPRTRIEDVRKTSMEDTNTSTEAGLVSFTNTIKTSPRRIPELDLKQIPDFEKAVYNVVMVGNSNVGKTSFIKRLQSGCFSPEYNSTIGVDTFVQTITFDSKTVKLYLWDTAGQERYHSITKQVFHKAQGLLLMYDITSSQSFLAVRAWISQVQEKASPDVIMMLLGNKNDCADREVQIQKGEDLSKEYNIPFMECSAATGENVLESLKTLAWLLLKQRVRKEDEYTTLQPKPQNRKSGCC